VGITPLDGDIGKFPEWADRMSAKMVRVHRMIGKLAKLV
jgi:hypothetical protein